MEQLLIILIFLAISFVNWLAQRAEEKRAREALEEEARRGPANPDLSEGETDTPPTARRRSAEEDELRKFFEALGLPIEEAKPEPPPPPPKPAPPPPPQPAATPAPAAQRKAESPAPTTATWTPQAQARAASRESLLTKEEREALERIKSGKAGVVSPSRPARRASPFRTGRALIDETVAMLKDPVSARKAVLLREILDRPAALRDTTPGGAVFQA